VGALAPAVGVRAACRALGLARATFYRRRPAAVEGRPGGPAGPRRPPRAAPRALSQEERRAVLDVLHSARFCDAAPAEVYGTLPDEGVYLASERTMYRLLAAAGETGERRAQRAHPAYAKPELLATGPNQVWSWDIERHEALPHRAVVKGHRCRPVAAGR
jgi:putative transposase